MLVVDPVGSIIMDQDESFTAKLQGASERPGGQLQSLTANAYMRPFVLYLNLSITIFVAHESFKRLSCTQSDIPVGIMTEVGTYTMGAGPQPSTR